MSIFDKLIKAKVGKFLRGAGTTIVAYLAPVLARNAGVELTGEQQVALAGAVGGAIVWLVNKTKHQFPDIGKFL